MPFKSLSIIIRWFQNKILRTMISALWFVHNDTLHLDLQLPTVAELITTLSECQERQLHRHPNFLALAFLDNSEVTRCFRQRHCTDFPFWSSSGTCKSIRNPSRIATYKMLWTDTIIEILLFNIGFCLEHSRPVNVEKNKCNFRPIRGEQSSFVFRYACVRRH